jgi:acyl-CoA thioester hydrolase
MPNSEFIGTVVMEGRVRPEWIDINQHMNVAYYLLAFDLAVDDLWAKKGLDESYIQSGEGTTFSVEGHITYQRELLENDPYVITAQIIAYDEKRLHQFQRMYHAEKGFLAATCEWMHLHVDPVARRVSPWRQDVLERFAELAEEHASLPLPPEAGRAIRVPNPMKLDGKHNG